MLLQLLKLKFTGAVDLNLTAKNANLWFETKDQYGTKALSDNATFYVYNESTGLNKLLTLQVLTSQLELTKSQYPSVTKLSLLN